MDLKCPRGERSISIQHYIVVLNKTDKSYACKEYQKECVECYI